MIGSLKGPPDEQVQVGHDHADGHDDGQENALGEGGIITLHDGQSP